MFNAERAAGLDVEAALVLDGVPHRVRIKDAQLDIAIGEALRPAFTLSGDPNLVAGLVYGGLTLDAVRAAGLSVEGDTALAQRFATLFPLPEKAEPAASL